MFTTLGSIAQAQEFPPQLVFSKIEKDLSNDDVTSITQDIYGYLWVGTKNGLNKYDGIAFESFANSSDSTSLPSNLIECLLQQSDSTLWIGTFEGLCKYDREKNSFVRIPLIGTNHDPNNTNKHEISDITEDRNGTVWVVNEREGIFFKEKKSDSFFHYQIPNIGRVTTWIQENDSVYWIGTYDDGVKRINVKTSTVTSYSPDPSNESSISLSFVEDMVFDALGNLFISGDRGLDLLPPNSNSFIHYGSTQLNYGGLLNDSEGRLWACVQNGSVLMYDYSAGEFYKFENDPNDPLSNPSFSYWSIYEDSESRIWLGSTLRGLTVIDEGLNRFKYYESNNHHYQKQSDDIIHAIVEDENENLWMATDGGGLVYFDRKSGTFDHMQNDPRDKQSLSSNAVLTICPMNRDELWLGTWMGGINIFDIPKGTFTRFLPEDPNLDKITFITKLSDDRIWIGSGGSGIYIYDLLTKEMINHESVPEDISTLSNDDVLVLFEDSQQNIWVGTWAEGISLLKKDAIEAGKFIRYQHDPTDSTSLAANRVRHIMEDSQNNIWAATYSGMSLFVDSLSSFQTFGVKDGLASDNVFSIIEDQAQNLWIGTDKGISKFNLTNQSFENYSAEDGLQQGSFTRNSVLKTKNGELIFGGSEGFNIFQPEKVKRNNKIPNVYISGLKIFNKKVEIADETGALPKNISLMDELILTENQSVFTLEFVSLNFTIPEKNQYAFKLIGLEEQWNYVGNNNSATYTSLDPGEYVFRVKASNNDGVWNEQGASLKIKILPHWWKTWWALAIWILIGSAVSLGLIFVVIYQRQKIALKVLVDDRTEELMRKNEELKAYDHMVSHDLKTPIGNIAMLAQLLSMDSALELKPDSKEILLQLINSSNLSVQLIEGILAFASADDPSEMEENVDLHFQMERVLEAHALKIKQTNCQVKLNDLPTIQQGVSVKVYQLFHNLIGNALKFKRDGVDLQIAIYMKNSNELVIEDNGLGFDQKYADEIFKPLRRLDAVHKIEGHGIGLGTCKRVVDFHGWQIRAEGQKGLGAKFIIKIFDQ